jgi:hypothetical protein
MRSSPGSGAAAEMGIELANRAAAFGGQAAAFSAQGLMQTFLPNGSALGDPSQNWLGKLAGGFAGAHPAGANSAGITGKAEPVQKPPNEVDPKGKEHGKGKGQAPGPGGQPLIGTMNYTGPQNDGQAVARDIDRKISSHGAGMGW